MNKMQWAIWSIDYLHKARAAIHDDFNAAMEELRGYHQAKQESWYGASKNIIQTLYHFSLEFVEDTDIPSNRFSSPESFERALANYKSFVSAMRDEIEQEAKDYISEHGAQSEPFLLSIARDHVISVSDAIDYVYSEKPEEISLSKPDDDIDHITNLARRFHEVALSLKHHPHNGETFEMRDEWDCQYIFRALICAYFEDVRDEEWNPSVAGSSTRCEFYLKSLRTLIELKYVRKKTDQKKIKNELAADFLDYSKNPEVDVLVCLVYDPNSALKNPVGFQSDLSGPMNGLGRVNVVVSPPRD